MPSNHHKSVLAGKRHDASLQRMTQGVAPPSQALRPLEWPNRLDPQPH